MARRPARDSSTEGGPRSSAPRGSAQRQRGGFVMGMVLGLLIGLGVALVVALYITKAPIPFVNKVPLRTAEQDAAEAERNKHWDPNGPLAGKNPARPQAPAPTASTVDSAGLPAADAASDTAPAQAATPSAPAAARAAASRPARDPAAILAGQADAGDAKTPKPARPDAAEPPAKPPSASAVQFYVQAGAFTTPTDAESQRAKLALMGMAAKVMEREQAGRTMYRVRMGPYDNRSSAEDVQDRLASGGVDANLVRVER